MLFNIYSNLANCNLDCAINSVLFSCNHVYLRFNHLSVHLDFTSKTWSVDFWSEESLKFLKSFWGVEDCCSDSDKCRKFHITADSLFKPAPIFSNPVPSSLLTMTVSKHTTVPTTKVLRLNYIRIFKVANNIVNFSNING